MIPVGNSLDICELRICCDVRTTFTKVVKFCRFSPFFLVICGKQQVHEDALKYEAVNRDTLFVGLARSEF